MSYLDVLSGKQDNGEAACPGHELLPSVLFRCQPGGGCHSGFSELIGSHLDCVVHTRVTKPISKTIPRTPTSSGDLTKTQQRLKFCAVFLEGVHV